MSVIFFTDPHLGVKRNSHTTPASRARLKDQVAEMVQYILNRAEEDGHEVFCLGDLFDTEENDEATILEGLTVAQRCSAVLAGNHDLPNRAGKLSSLQLIDQAVPGKIIVGSVDEPGFDFRDTDEGRIYFVPHMATQELFEQSLAEAAAHASKEGSAAALCLHCNYENGLVHNGLMLSRQWAEALLEVFDFVLLGHEHVARSDFGGRLQILGNTLPLSFGEITDRFVWELKAGKLSSHALWLSKLRSAVVPWEDLDSREWDVEEYIEVVGEAEAAEMPAVARAIQQIWSQAPGALMIRNNVEVKEAISAVEGRELARMTDVPTRVSHALAGTKMENLWKHYLERVQ